MSLRIRFGETVHFQPGKNDLLKALWGDEVELQGKRKACYVPLGRYYFQKCRQASENEYANQNWTHQDVVETIGFLRKDESRKTIRSMLSSKYPPQPNGKGSQHQPDVILELAVRLWAMMEVDPSLETHFVGQHKLTWTDGSLRDGVKHFFEEAKASSRTSAASRIPQVLNARYLEKIAGIEIVWTTNLAEHLAMVANDDSKIAVFHHAEFLNIQLKMADSVFPKDVIEETLDTLRLLFPQHTKKVKSWYSRLQSGDLNLDATAANCGPLQRKHRRIKDFQYWGERLEILNDAFENAEPDGFQQWWYLRDDPRRRVQWSTFWVAIVVLLLTIFVGLVQSIEGAIQVYKAYYPS